MIRALLGLFLACGAPQSDEGPLGVALLRLEGPTEGALLEAGGPPTEVRVDLRAGEQRTLSVPLELGPLAAPGVPAPDSIVVRALPGGEDPGAVAIVGWEAAPREAAPFAGDPGPGSERRALERLARRTRPPLAPARARAGAVDLALIAALLCLGLGLRQRPVAAAILGLGGALLVFGIPSERAPTGEVWVLEGDLTAGAWLEVRAGLGSLALEPGEVQPVRAGRGTCARSYRVEARGSAVRWWALAPGCDLGAARRLAPPELGPDRNGLGRLDPFWVRDPTGAWERRAAWEPGRALPIAAQGAGNGAATDAPPAWLAAALPQGREVWVGRLDRAPGDGAARVWVRALGP